MKFRVLFSIGMESMYVKTFNLDTLGILGAASEIKLWEKFNENALCVCLEPIIE